MGGHAEEMRIATSMRVLIHDMSAPFSRAFLVGLAPPSLLGLGADILMESITGFPRVLFFRSIQAASDRLNGHFANVAAS